MHVQRLVAFLACCIVAGAREGQSKSRAPSSEPLDEVEIPETVLLSHSSICEDERTIEEALADNGAIQREELEEVSNGVHALALAAAVGRGAVSPQVIPHRRSLAALDRGRRRDNSIAALELLLEKKMSRSGKAPERDFLGSHNATTPEEDQKAWSLRSKYLERANIDIVVPPAGFEEEVFQLAQSLPCMAGPPERDRLRQPVAVIPNDPTFYLQWHMMGESLDSKYGVDAVNAWGWYSGSQDETVVAVLDTGCSVHPDLEISLWANPAVHCTTADDFFEKDCFGWDFGDDDANPFDEPMEALHGTAVAGVIAARPNNGWNLAGVCWNCKIMCLKVWDSRRGGITLSAILKAHDYMLAKGVKISNHSYGGHGTSTAERISIDALRDAGHLMVCAAGNSACNIDKVFSMDPDACKSSSGNPQGLLTPGGYDHDNIITVGASMRNGKIADFSNFGKTKVDVFAPGYGVASLWNTQDDRAGMAYVYGTSFSSPLVAGIAALVWGSNPDLTYLEVKEAIMSVERIDEFAEVCVSGGVANAYESISRYANKRDTPLAEQAPPTRDLTRSFYSDRSAGHATGAGVQNSPVLWFCLLLHACFWFARDAA